MDILSIAVWLYWACFVHETLSQEDVDTTVALTAPINPVREEAMISIHCQIWNKGDTQEVTMSRRLTGSSTSERLTWGDKVQLSDDRIFLAERRLADSSVVYFLSVIDISREDQGLYFCKVISNVDDTIKEVASASVNVEVQYYPDDNPVCELGLPDALTVQSGTEVKFKCTAERAFPTAELEWSRTSSTFSDKGNQTVKEGQVSSVLSMRLFTRDQQAVFLCKLTSTAFPGKLKTCHIGPFTVIPNPLIDEPEPEEVEPETGMDSTGNTEVGYAPTFPTPKTKSNDVLIKSEHCADMCSNVTSTVLYWMIGTVVSGILAILFVIIGILFALKLNRLHTVSRQRSALTPVQRQISEDLYERLECRPDGNPRVYMSLDRLKKPGILVVKERRDIDRDYTRDYTGTPTAPSM